MYAVLGNGIKNSIIVVYIFLPGLSMSWLLKITPALVARSKGVVEAVEVVRLLAVLSREQRH
jgi:hypothetical protein